MSEIQRRLITYCSNIHPAESWQGTFAALREHVPVVKRRVAPDTQFPIGLRLSARAAKELAAAGTASFDAWLEEQGCFVPTVNGFPYGAFHGARVKRSAYLPDWHSRERAQYTKLLAELLARWLPQGVTGSISTVPVGFKAHISPVEFRARLLDVLWHLERLRQDWGAEIVLSLEPEPGCVLETAADFVQFLEWMDFPEGLMRHIGICLDCCHHAVQFEEPAQVLALLKESGVRIGKVQASSALSVGHGGREALEQFDGSTYLHQVVIRDGEGTLHRYDDLPEALKLYQGGDGDEWRCHFHVPLFVERAQGVETTRHFVEGLIPGLDPQTLIEVETYTWGVSPPQLRSEGVAASIVREIRWLQETSHAKNGRP